MAYLSYAYHGGDCCGLFHMFGFSVFRGIVFDAAALRREISDLHEELIEENEDGDDNTQRVIEIVLTDDQFTYIDKNVLTEVGFVPVSRFFNSNSGNTCTVFHYHPDGIGVAINDVIMADLPIATHAYRPAPPAPRVIRSEFINVYAHGDGTRVFPEAALADASAGRARNPRIRLDRVDHRDDGTSIRVTHAG